ncbi:MAG: phage tail sheath protein FI [Cellvibrionaceae bacterium]|jgi:phage tail sheath protein FI
MYEIPGIYVEEVSTGPKPISAASTTTCGFIGTAPQRKAFVNQPTACNNFEEFCKKFIPEDRSTIKDFALAYAVYGFFLNGGSRCYIVNVDGGSIAGDIGKKTGVWSLQTYDEIALIAAPEATNIADQTALIDFCEHKKSCFAILDGPENFEDVTELTTIAIEEAPSKTETDIDKKEGGVSKFKPKRPKPTSFAAQYVPHLVMTSPFSNEKTTCAPSGHIAGIYARTDTSRGVHKAPANVTIRGCTGLTQRITDPEQAQLNSNYVNCIRYFASGGIRVWGARTLSNDNAEWRYINVRRMFLMIEESIKRGTSWTVFEPNDLILCKSITRDISAFLKLQWQSGALVGSSPSEAFFVKCDGENNPQESVNEGRLIVDIGIAPSKPAEFIIFRIGQWEGAEALDSE